MSSDSAVREIIQVPSVVQSDSIFGSNQSGGSIDPAQLAALNARISAVEDIAAGSLDEIRVTGYPSLATYLATMPPGMSPGTGLQFTDGSIYSLRSGGLPLEPNDWIMVEGPRGAIGSLVGAIASSAEYLKFGKDRWGQASVASSQALAPWTVHLVAVAADATLTLPAATGSRTEIEVMLEAVINNATVTIAKQPTDTIAMGGALAFKTPGTFLQFRDVASGNWAII